MGKAIYHGPGDAIEMDGLRFERGTTYAMTNGQITRIRASDPNAAVEIVDSAPETPLELAKITDAQDRMRDDAIAAADKEAARAQDEADKLARASAERTAKAAAEREKTAAERDAARREAAAPRKTTRKES